MNEEELFCKLFPEYVVNGKPLSPYWDLFESGYEQAEKHIAEHKCECERCIHTDCPCVLSDYGKDRNGICDHFKDVFDENAELKEKVNILDNCDRLGDVITEAYKKQLTKAKEYIREFMKYEINEYDGSLEIHFEELKKQAVQFLSEVEK